jgi:tRNA-2-methylthio-N6-dimethylallyladenosine synthase
MTSKNYFIKTYGCQMNENDSEIMAGILESKGFKPAADIASADIIIANTCSVRDGAERKAKGFIAGLAHLKNHKKSLLVGVTGCMAERMGEEILKKYKFVDFVLGPNREMEIEDVVGGSPRAVRTGDAPDFKDSSLAKRQGSVNAWVTIMEGCNNFCSYCIVPYVRGREKSRPVDDVLREIEGLNKDLFKEVTLLGQNVNSYEFRLAKLLEEVSKIDGIRRIKFMTSHPRDMGEDIIRAVAENEKVCEFFHLPLQSGDDDVLKAMNRGYDSSYYRGLVKKIRNMVPSAAITSDVIAGFPGETEKNFENTLDLIRELELDSVNTLAFDPRPGTAAEKLSGRLPHEAVSGRLQRLMRVVEETALKKNSSLTGSVQELLVESPVTGRTRTNKIVKFSSKKAKQGDIVKARITAAKSWVLQGEIID